MQSNDVGSSRKRYHRLKRNRHWHRVLSLFGIEGWDDRVGIDRTDERHGLVCLAEAFVVSLNASSGLAEPLLSALVLEQVG